MIYKTCRMDYSAVYAFICVGFFFFWLTFKDTIFFLFSLDPYKAVAESF